jgi:hypothetical protein
MRLTWAACAFPPAGVSWASGPDCVLSLWWSERFCASNFTRSPGHGLGIWEEGDTRTTFCVECDRSTETLERREKKLKSYEDLQIASGRTYWMLFCSVRHRDGTFARC